MARNAVREKENIALTEMADNKHRSVLFCGEASGPPEKVKSER